MPQGSLVASTVHSVVSSSPPFSSLALRFNPAPLPPPQLARVHEPFARAFAAAQQHPLPRLRVPPVHPALAPASFADALAAYPPCPQLRILPVQMSEGQREPVERFVVEELLADTIWAWEDGNRQGTRHIVADQLGADNQPMDFPYDGMLAEAARRRGSDPTRAVVAVMFRRARPPVIEAEGL